MAPTFLPGQKVVVQKKWFFCTFNVQDIVILKDPRNGKLLIKRIKKIRHSGESALADDSRIPASRQGGSKRSWVRSFLTYQDDEYYVVGDNKSESTDSRTFGWIRKDAIIGKVVYR